MSGIEAEHYGETRARLVADPIIQQMAHELRDMDVAELVHASGTPRHEFMMAALREWQTRGGDGNTHIGGPAEAILEILRRNA